MLNVMRENLRTLKFLLWIVAFSMVAYLGAFFSCDRPDAETTGNWAAQVNGKGITLNEFRRVARNMDGYYRDLFGTNYDQIRPNIAIGTQAIRALVDQEVALQEAQRLGLEVTPEDVRDVVTSDPRFQEDGQFVGNERYVEAMDRTYPGGVVAFEKDVCDQILLDRWTAMVTESVRVEESELEKEYRRRTEKTEVDFVVVASASQTVETKTTAEQEQSWFDAHEDDYMRSDGRRIRYVTVRRDAELAKVQLSDAEIQASYEENVETYSHPEQRRARHILFRAEPGASQEDRDALRAKAEDTLARIRGGESFETLSDELSDDPVSASKGGDLGFFARNDMVAEFETVAFGTPVGELAEVTESPFGFHVIEVLEERPAGVKPLEDVRGTIERSLRLRRAQENVESEAQRMLADVTTAEAIAEVAEREGLEVEIRFVAGDDRLADLGASPEFLSGVNELQPGEVAATPLRVAAGLALVAVDELVPASVAPLDEVRDRVRSDILNDRTREAALTVASKALRDEDLGVVDAAARLELEIQQSGPLAPGSTLPGTGGMSPELQEALFGEAVQVGNRGAVSVPAGALIYEVIERVDFDESAFAGAKPDLRRELISQQRNIARQAFIDRLKEQQEIVINEAIVESADRG